jgi:hypothetical protein
MLGSRGRLIVLAGAAAAYVFFIVWYHAPYAGGSDSSGYLNSARLMLAGRLTALQSIPAGLTRDVLPRELIHPLGYVPSRTNAELLPIYPVGLPLHFAAIGRIIGLGPATTAVALASAIGLVWLLYLVARAIGLRPSWAGAVAGLAGLSPLTLRYALQPMSDLVAATWGLLTILCALRTSRHWAWAFAAGGALAMSVLVRPTNLLLVAPTLVALAPCVRTWLAFVAGGTPGALLLAWYNHSVYERIVTTGYGDASSLFAWKNVSPTLAHYATWIPVVASPLVFAACALPFLRLERRLKALLLLWGGVLPLFYSFYECTQETWWYLRFLLPALPAFGIAAGLALQQVRFPDLLIACRLLPASDAPGFPDARRFLRIPVAMILLLTTAGWFVSWNRHLGVRFTELDERAYRLAGEWARDHLTPGSIVAAHQVSGALLYYADLQSLNFNTLTPEQSVRFLAWLDARQQPLNAVLYPFEVETVQSTLPGRWERITELRQVTVWRRMGPSP